MLTALKYVQGEEEAAAAEIAADAATNDSLKAGWAML